MKPILHRVDRVRAPVPPPLPKEATPIGPREYRDRFGAEFSVQWNSLKSDPPLCEMRPTVLK